MKLLTMREVAAKLRVSTKTIRRWIDGGILPVVQMTKRKILFEEAKVEAVVRSKERPARRK